MNRAALLPPEVAQALADVLEGLPLNGTNPATTLPPWRGLLQAASLSDRADRQAHIDAALLQAQFTPAEISSLWGEVQAFKPGGHPTKERAAIEILSRADLRLRPKPVPLIDGHLQQKALACLFGPSGIGKSFVALSFACSLVTGFPWFGHQVAKGSALYLAAEGDDDMDNRISAWEREYNGGRMLKNMAIVPHGIDLRASAAPTALLQAVGKFGLPDLRIVVIDTLARNMTGDENSTEHMGQLVRQCDVLWQETGCLVLLVHHTGKNGEQERGSSALKGAVNTMLKLTKDDENQYLTLKCEKQKNAKEFSPWTFVLKEVTLDNGESSCVLDLAAGRNRVQQLPPIQKKILDVLAWSMNAGGIGSSRLREGIGAKDESARTAMYAAVNRLHDLQLITITGQHSRQLYSISASGQNLLHSLNTQKPTADVF